MPENNLSLQSGVTLVELMVASSILAISITAAISILKTGLDLEYNRNLERQAFRLAHSALENPAYHYSPGYATMANSNSTVTVNPDGLPVEMAIDIQVTEEPSEPWLHGGTLIATWNNKRVGARVSWSVGGETRTVQVSKIVSEVE